MPARALPPHGPYTVVYTDVDASTRLNDRLGDAAEAELLRAHRALVRAELTRQGGAELTQLGDGFKLAFPDPTRAIAFAVGLERALEAEREGRGGEGVSVRVGVHSGDATLEEGDLFGRTVIVAQRVLSRAQPGQILVSQSAAAEARLPAGVSTLDRGVFLLKGLQDGFRLYEVLWRPGSEPAARPSDEASPLPTARDALPRPPLVGRRAELGALESRLDAAEKGAGSVVLLCGEPGIGKTRLCAEFLELIARRRVRRAVGRCFAEGGVPYGPFVECLVQLHAAGGLAVPRALAGDLSALLRVAAAGTALEPPARGPRRERDPADARARLHGALASLLAEWSRAAPVVLLLDDLQWADAGTLEALRAVGRRLAPRVAGEGSRVLVLAAVRAQEAQAPALGPLLRELDRDRVLARLPVDPLGAGDVRALVRSLLRTPPPTALADRVAERSQGNPYFVEELCRDLEERRSLEGPLAAAAAAGAGGDWNVPAQLRGVLEERLARLSDDGLAALRVASLLGPRFRFDLWCEASGLEAERALACVEEALAARVLREEPDARPVRYSFEHVLVSDVLRDGLARPRRQRLHLRIAQALERLQPEEPAEIARHLSLAGEAASDARLAHWCEAAGLAAARLHASPEAARLLGEALDARERMGGADSVEADRLRLALFPVLGQGGDVGRARDLAERALGALEARGDFAAADPARATLARLLRHHALPADALQVLKPALRRAEPETAAHGALLAEAAVALDLVGDAATMRDTAERLRSLARRSGNDELEEQALTVLRNWSANHTTRVERALELSRRLLARARQRRDPWDEAVFGSDVGLFELVTGRVRQALATLERALEAAERVGALSALINVRAVRALCFCFRGEWSRVEEEWGLAAPLLGRVPGALRTGLLFWARTRSDLWRGRPGPPVPDSEQLYAGITQFQNDVLAGAGLVAAERRAPAAAEILRRVAARQPRSGSGVNWLTASQALAAGFAELGAAGEATPWYDALAPYRGSLLVGCTDLILGRIALLDGRLDAAARDLARAARLARREELGPFLVLTLREQARLSAARGRPRYLSRARALRARADTLAERLDMREWTGGREPPLGR